MNHRVLLVESNLISLRTAYVTDLGNLVGLSLNPADITSKIRHGQKFVPKDFEWVLKDSVWLYRHVLPISNEKKLKNEMPYVVDHGVMQISFLTPPNFRLHWADSGQSVALYLNGEPWAFIDEVSHTGYSKGIINSMSGNLWDEDLFQERFDLEL